VIPEPNAFIMNKLLAFAFLSLFLFNCTPKPEACFTFSISNQVVQFDGNCSDNEDEYLWNFGDNTTSTIVNPEHTYAAIGTYSVTLEVKNKKHSKSETKTIAITKACGTCTCKVVSGSATFSESKYFCGTREEIDDYKTTQKAECDSSGGTYTCVEI
tara:strand:- start:5420 stop:5890 length:471 start_codon:yes stop_codon:yes gene_type:complete